MKEWSRLKKAAVISAVTLFGISGISALSGPQKNNTAASETTTPVVTTPEVQGENTQNVEQPVQTTPPATSTPTQDTTTPTHNNSQSCPNGTYVNSDGIIVCSPYSAPTAPAGATAQCVDGTYSFSSHHSGTCSHHGGVATWL